MKTLVVIFAIIILYTGCSENEQIKNNIPIWYSTKYLYFAHDSLNDQSSPYAEIKLQFPEFISDENDISSFLNSEIQSKIRENFREEWRPLEFPEIAKNFMNEFNSFRNDFPDAPSGWFIETTIDVISTKNKIVSVKTTHFEFMGGAHPNSYVNYYNFDLKHKQIIKLEALMKPGEMQNLTGLAEKIFRKNKHIPEDANLADYGFMFENDVFYINENFLLTDEGILFLYNNYEIAPYAYGRTELFIKFNDIKHMLKNPDSFSLSVKY